MIDKYLMAYAPYIAGILSAMVAYLSLRESRRKTKHDEAIDLLDMVNKDNDRLREENEELKKKNLELTRELEELRYAK
jgi:cell shape-determining protein MreC